MQANIYWQNQLVDEHSGLPLLTEFFLWWWGKALKNRFDKLIVGLFVFVNVCAFHCENTFILLNHSAAFFLFYSNLCAFYLEIEFNIDVLEFDDEFLCFFFLLSLVHCSLALVCHGMGFAVGCSLIGFPFFGVSNQFTWMVF